ncbi:alpha-L-glutamate ligase-like protein [Haloferula luteola]|uniref:Alpha-L-glutamate ligase-like protein n=1 Tax=Haloferula luteola TaxID=595692 RepID=A0A840VB10_9BACT|nr:alpha-L-glutamate ligase-like protein [Haloferula luteola]MBB5350081.1 alpha-L-glutamate ligase-like protein [Haloferula luteola]
MTRWWHRWFRTPAELREMGVVGINMRNARYVLPSNPRKLYDLVDNKVRTKSLAVERGISVPETYGVVTNPGDVRNFERMLEGRESFVIKPTRGSGGKGVLVIAGREDGMYLKPSGAQLSVGDVRNHLQNILAGLHSLGGKRDTALIEYKVAPEKTMTSISFQGAPDIRVVLFHGYPVLAMLRASTRESDGRSNLHQGALGIGVDIRSGKTVHAVHHGRAVKMHPDLKVPLVGVTVPEWERILEIAVQCYEMTGLGYLGVDLMIDENRGPLMIEVNARPGLAIQLANGVGLLKRLEPITERRAKHPGETPAERLLFSKNRFAPIQEG